MEAASEVQIVYFLVQIIQPLKQVQFLNEDTFFYPSVVHKREVPLYVNTNSKGRKEEKNPKKPPKKQFSGIHLLGWCPE